MQFFPHNSTPGIRFIIWKLISEIRFVSRYISLVFSRREGKWKLVGRPAKAATPRAWNWAHSVNEHMLRLQRGARGRLDVISGRVRLDTPLSHNDPDHVITISCHKHIIKTCTVIKGRAKKISSMSQFPLLTPAFWYRRPIQSPSAKAELSSLNFRNFSARPCILAASSGRAEFTQPFRMRSEKNKGLIVD